MKNDASHFDCGLDFFQGIKGTGTITWGNQELSASFTLTVSPDYSVEIATAINVDHSTASEMFRGDLSKERVDDFGIEGVTEKGFKFSCGKARRRDSSVRFDRDPVHVQVLATPVTRMRMRAKTFKKGEVTTITFGIMNLDGAGRSLNFRVGSHEICAKALPMFDSIKESIKNGNIPRAVTYEFTTELSSMSELEDLENQIYVLSLMLSIAKINDIKPFYSLVRSGQGDVIAATVYTDLREAEFINFFKIIDDAHTRGGTEQYVNNCYEEFSRIHEQMNLHPFIIDMLFAARTEWTDISMVVLILGLEYLVTHYGRTILGWDTDDTRSLIRKLKRLNTHLRSIPSRYLDGKWTKRIRNPLIHTGIIVNLSHEERIEALYDLYRLTALVFLRLTGYQGSYLDFSWPPRLNSMPGKQPKR